MVTKLNILGALAGIFVTYMLGWNSVEFASGAALACFTLLAVSIFNDKFGE
jgi:hypothetical protein